MSALNVNFDYWKARKRNDLVDDGSDDYLSFPNVRGIHYTTKSLVHFPDLKKKFMKMGGGIQIDEKAQKLKDMLISSEGSLQKHDGTSHVFLDVQCRSSWLTSSLIPRPADIHLGIATAIFGRHVTEIHVDGGSPAFCYTILEGEKEWLFWKPGRSPLYQYRPPDYYVRTKVGDSIYGDCGWWHLVRTVSNGALHCGFDIIVPESITSFVLCSKLSRCSRRELEILHSDATIIAKTLTRTSYVFRTLRKRWDNSLIHWSDVQLLQRVYYSCVNGTAKRKKDGCCRRTKNYVTKRPKRGKSKTIRKSTFDRVWEFRCKCNRIDNGSTAVQCTRCSVWMHQRCVKSQLRRLSGTDFLCEHCEFLQRVLVEF